MVGKSCLSLSSRYKFYFVVVVVVESSVTVVYPRSNQSSTGGLDDLNGLLCVQRALNTKCSRNKTEIFTAVVEPELLSYSSDVTCVTDVVVSKSFALSLKST